MACSAGDDDAPGAPTSGGAPAASGGASTSGGAPAANGGTSTSAGGGFSGGFANSGGSPSSGSAGTGGSIPSTSGGAASSPSGGQGANGGSAGKASGGSSGTSASAGSAGISNGGTAQGGAPTTGIPDANNGADGASKPTGFAAIAGMGIDTTTGGAGAPQVTATTFEELAGYLDSEAPQIIFVKGTIDLEGGMVPMRSNKSLIGLEAARLVNGGIEMNKRQNIIVRNITFADGTDDTFKINQNTHHVWVDHCDFTKAADGLFDITRQSSFITISWNKFYEHSKTMLIGHSDAETGDVGYLKTTIHHNWFNGTEQRHPRVRFGQVHVFNNYFLSNALYGVASTMEADVVVEGNYFEGLAFPIYSGYQESGPGDVVERNNLYVNSGTPQTRGSAFEPSIAYSYVVENPNTLPTALRMKAGVGVIDPMAAAR